jgi:DNA-binding winged helix-turn-helix (wHTH) protein
MQYLVGDFVVDKERRQIRLRSGTGTGLTGKPVDVLLVLLDAADNKAANADIVSTVWPGEPLTDSTKRRIEAHIKSIRVFLNDDPTNPSYIQTIYGEGYRLVAPATRMEADAEPLTTPLISQAPSSNVSSNPPISRFPIGWARPAAYAGVALALVATAAAALFHARDVPSPSHSNVTPGALSFSDMSKPDGVDALNHANWIVESPPTVGVPGTVTLQGEAAVMSMPAGDGGIGINTSCSFNNDFDVQVDYELQEWSAGNLHSVMLRTIDLPSPYRLPGIYRRSESMYAYGVSEREGDRKEIYAISSPQGFAAKPTSDTRGTLRVARTGQILSAWTRGERGFELVGSGVVGTGRTRIALELGTGSPVAPPGIRIAFRNFVINSGKILCVPQLGPG